MKTFRFEFLGCKVNQYDAEKARRYLLERGFQETTEDASLLLLASCTVTSTAARKGRQSIRSLLRKHPGAEVAVMGCMTEADRSFYNSLEAPVTVLPSATDDAFLDRLAPAAHRVEPGPEPARPMAPTSSRRRTRAFLKVEDGCDLSCSFCIIPSVRGRARSRAVREVVAEVRELIARSVPEIVLTGVHLGHYGRRAEATLLELLERVVAVPGDWRLRLSSLEVSELDEGILGLIRDQERIVPHLHLPLQSGSPRILRQMRRPYTADQFRTVVERVRDQLPDPGLTTDVILGFPGETEADFQETLDLCEDAGFSKIHQFPFSPREGTDAATLPGRLPGEVVRERKARLLELEGRLRRRALERRIGRSARMVVEVVEADGGLRGYDERYHRTRVPAPRDRTEGSWVDVRGEGVDDPWLVATPL